MSQAIRSDNQGNQCLDALKKKIQVLVHQSELDSEKLCSNGGLWRGSEPQLNYTAEPVTLQRAVL